MKVFNLNEISEEIKSETGLELNIPEEERVVFLNSFSNWKMSSMDLPEEPMDQVLEYLRLDILSVVNAGEGVENGRE